MIDPCVQKSEEKLRTTLIALGDARVMLIKLADSVQQARNLSALPDEKKALFLLAMQNIFVPVANRLGIWCFKAELEDLCFKVCHSYQNGNLFLNSVVAMTKRSMQLRSMLYQRIAVTAGVITKCR
jgi:(p)ppGpp synthase/HD superfamily hydrolase